METAQHKTVNRAATVQPAAALKTVPRQTAATTPIRVPSFAKVSSPHDPAEQEAEATASKIMRLAVPESSVAYVKTGRGGMFRQVKPEEKEKRPQLKLQSPYLTRFAASGIFPKQKDEDEKIHRKFEELPKERERIHRKLEGQPEVSPNVAAQLEPSLAEGIPLPLSVRRFMEPRFQADFSKVKIHTGQKAASLNRQFSAQAFTVGNQIFFGKDKFKPDTLEGQELIAHELTHTIQQGGVVQRRAVRVTQQSPPLVQRLGISDILDYIAEKAYNIPGYRMFTIVLGVNPINMESVDRSAANILRAMVEFMPLGHQITQALDKYGVFEEAGAWVKKQLDTLGMVGKAFYDALMAFVDSLGWGDLAHPIRTVERAIKIFTDPVDKLLAFAKGIASGIISLIKKAILRPLAALAKGRFPGWYDLLKVILGEDPVTEEKVEPTPDLVIGSFMKLIGQEEVWLNLKKANAVARAWAWFKGVLSSLLKFVTQIPSLLLTAIKSLTIEDIILLPRALVKVASVFGSFIADFIKWGLNAVLNLLEIIFSVVAPTAVPYLKKTGSAFSTIIKHPIAFVGHLVQAGKLGFQQFSSKFGTYLKQSLLEWLTGTLGPSMYIPQSFEIQEIIKFVLSVLGLTWQNIRAKLVKVVGETTVKIMETEFDIVVTLVTQGPAAAWEKIYAQLTNLQELVMGEITKYVTVTVVQNAIAKLLTMLTPAGAFIQAIIAIYNTIMFFVERLRQIIKVVTAFLDSLAAIAAGVIVAAAKRVETTLAGLLTLVISFLARFAGLGKLGDAVTNIINKIRTPIDLALDKVVEWIMSMAKKLGRFFGFGTQPGQAPDLGIEVVESVPMRGHQHSLKVTDKGGKPVVELSTTPAELIHLCKRVADQIQASKSYDVNQKKAIIPSLDGIAFAAGEIDSDIKHQAEDLLKGVRKDPEAERRKIQLETKKRAATLANDLKALAVKYKISELDDFLEAPPSQRFFPGGFGGKKIRALFYDNMHSWGSHRDKYVDKRFPFLRNAVIQARDQKDDSKWQRLQEIGWVDRGARMWVVKGVKTEGYDPDPTKIEYWVDHKTPVAQLWNAEGNNTSDDKRGEKFLQESNLELTTKSYNISKGSGDINYDLFVRPGFTSSVVEGGEINAKIFTPLGKPFE